MIPCVVSLSSLGFIRVLCGFWLLLTNTQQTRYVLVGYAVVTLCLQVIVEVLSESSAIISSEWMDW